MYVTDVPVMDRLTDRVLGPLFSAADQLEDALGSLAGWTEELAPDIKPNQWTPSAEEVAKGVTDATDEALYAADILADVLATLPPTTL